MKQRGYIFRALAAVCMLAALLTACRQAPAASETPGTEGLPVVVVGCDVYPSYTTRGRDHRLQR